MFPIHFPNITTILQPGNLIAWIIAGLIAGWLASIIVRGRGFGCIGNIVVGLIGAFVGSFLIDVFNISLSGPMHFIGTVVVSFIGAAIFLFIVGLFTGRN